MDNFFVVIIIIGVILNLVSKYGKEQKSDTKQRNKTLSDFSSTMTKTMNSIYRGIPDSISGNSRIEPFKTPQQMGYVPFESLKKELSQSSLFAQETNSESMESDISMESELSMEALDSYDVIDVLDPDAPFAAKESTIHSRIDTNRNSQNSDFAEIVTEENEGLNLTFTPESIFTGFVISEIMKRPVYPKRYSR